MSKETAAERTDQERGPLINGHKVVCFFGAWGQLLFDVSRGHSPFSPSILFGIFILSWNERTWTVSKVNNVLLQRLIKKETKNFVKNMTTYILFTLGTKTHTLVDASFPPWSSGTAVAVKLIVSKQVLNITRFLVLKLVLSQMFYNDYSLILSSRKHHCIHIPCSCSQWYQIYNLSRWGWQ